MENIKIISSYDCLAVCQGKQVFLQQNQIYALENSEKIFIYPAGGTRRPSFCIDPSVNESSRFFDVILTEKCKIFCLSNAPICQNFQVHRLTMPDGQCLLQIGESRIEIEYLHNKKVIELQECFSTYKVGVESGYVFVLLTGKRRQNLVLFNTADASVKLLAGDQVRLSGQSVFVTSDLENIARQSVETRYTLSTDGVQKEDEQISYQNGRPTLVMTPQVVPFAFLQALQVGDASLASNYLDLPMKRQIDDEHLLGFFGQIRNFFALDVDQYVVIGSQQQGVFKFVMQDNRISEIFALE